ncbi:MAG: hypothetical protein K9K64_00495 [Desulfohalobiaceae bacterium]|nr:hypothetical protein [Desulfohalobiaceae bacterium]
MNRAEVFRKGLHLLALCIPFGIAYLPWHVAVSVLVPATVLLVASEILRKKWTFLQKYFLKIFKAFLRPEEKTQLTGATYFLIAGLLCILLFDRPIAYTVTAFMIVGDAAAALVGMHFGKIRLSSGKSLEGTAACVAACLLFWTLFPKTGFAMALTAAFLTGALELFLTGINDNLAVPVICGLILQTGTGW